MNNNQNHELNNYTNIANENNESNNSTFVNQSNTMNQNNTSSGYSNTNQDSMFYNSSIMSNNKRKINKKIMLGVGIFLALIIIFIIVKTNSKGGSTSGGAVLQKSTSQYSKVCTMNQEYESTFLIDMTFGLYEKDGSIKQDNVFVWTKKDGDKLKPTKELTESDMITAFAMLSPMTYEDSTSSNVNNYLKNGKVYITSTVTYNSGKYSSIEDLAKEFESSGAVCK